MGKKKNKKKPIVSVVMPVYNAEKYLAEAIESVLNQTFKDFEFIIVDDGSTDKSLEIIKEYAKGDKRIKIMKNEKNMGISKTRNRGIKKAIGKYIATHDADDISFPNRFKEQIDYLEKNKECGVVGSYIEIFNDKTKKSISIRKYPKSDEGLRKIIFFCSPIAQPASIIRRDIFSKVGFYDKRYPPTEDLDLWFRIGKKYKLANIPKVLLRYRFYPDSATGSKTKLIEKLSIEIRWKNRNEKSYKFGYKEFLYILFHKISLYIIPSKFKMWLFGKIRDKKK